MAKQHDHKPAAKPDDKPAAKPGVAAPGAADPINGSPPPGGVQPPQVVGAHATHATDPADVKEDGTPKTPGQHAGDVAGSQHAAARMRAQMSDAENKRMIAEEEGKAERLAMSDKEAEKLGAEAKERAERIAKMRKELERLESGEDLDSVGNTYAVRCDDPALRPMVVVAATEADAWAKFLAINGATNSTYPYTVTETDDEPTPLPKRPEWKKAR